jgi:hypothetical protein
MTTADQLLAHAIGDYLLQSHWMAENKTRRSDAALVHALTYALPFLTLKPSKTRLAGIIGTHFLIDRFRLARYVCWAKNGPWKPLTATGYPNEVPAWLAVWLLIIADNTLHVAINGFLLKAEGAR